MTSVAATLPASARFNIVRMPSFFCWRFTSRRGRGAVERGAVSGRCEGGVPSRIRGTTVNRLRIAENGVRACGETYGTIHVCAVARARTGSTGGLGGGTGCALLSLTSARHLLTGARHLGLDKGKEMQAEFKAMDSKGGGAITFDAFSVWVVNSAPAVAEPDTDSGTPSRNGAPLPSPPPGRPLYPIRRHAYRHTGRYLVFDVWEHIIYYTLSRIARDQAYYSYRTWCPYFACAGLTGPAGPAAATHTPVKKGVLGLVHGVMNRVYGTVNSSAEAKGAIGPSCIRTLHFPRIRLLSSCISY